MRVASAIMIVLIALPAKSRAGAPPSFSEQAAQRGLSYVMQGWPQPYGYLGFGCGFADLDGDGDPDVIVMGAADGHVGLFENSGDGHFVDRSATSGVPALFEGSSFSAADIDRDGDVDLYFTQFGQANVLMKNQGNFHFTNVTAQAGVGDAGAGKAAIFGDYDDDGDLDLYVCNYNGIVDDSIDTTNRLYRNQGNGEFEDVSEAQGVDDPGHGFQAVWFDYDADGDVDLYLSNDRGHLPPAYHGNQLWRNDDGALVNVSAGSGADVHLFSMGVACGDFDGNGAPDLYCTNVSNYPDGFNPLLMNQGDGTFVELSSAAGVADWATSWGSVFFDYNNDTYMDLYVNNMNVANVMYVCGEHFPCDERAADLGLLGEPTPSFTTAIADVDGDGDLDLLSNDLVANVNLYINNSVDQGRWIRFELLGVSGLAHAVGGRVSIRIGNRWMMQEVLAGGNGYLGQNETIVHFGLGLHDNVDEVVAQWPGGRVTRGLGPLPGESVWRLYPPSRLGDATHDGVVDVQDLSVMIDCYGAAVVPGCESMDFNGDSVIDSLDTNLLLNVYVGPKGDCNRNRIHDAREIAEGVLQDEDGDGKADGCRVWPVAAPVGGPLGEADGVSIPP
jgi:hypothetical protein